MATRLGFHLVSVLGRVPMASFVPHRQINPSSVLLERSVGWANPRAVDVQLVMLRNLRHLLGAQSVCRECMQGLQDQHCVHSVLQDNIKTEKAKRVVSSAHRDITRTLQWRHHAGLL